MEIQNLDPRAVKSLTWFKWVQVSELDVTSPKTERSCKWNHQHSCQRYWRKASNRREAGRIEGSKHASPFLKRKEYSAATGWGVWGAQQDPRPGQRGEGWWGRSRNCSMRSPRWSALLSLGLSRQMLKVEWAASQPSWGLSQDWGEALVCWVEAVEWVTASLVSWSNWVDICCAVCCGTLFRAQ